MARYKKIFEENKKITIIGLSPREDRDSFRVADYLIGQNYEVDAIRPGAKQILGAICYKTIGDVPHALEIVNVFRAPEHVPSIVKSLIPLRPKVLWLQEGVMNAEAEEEARQAGIEVISDTCIKKIHQEVYAV